MKLKKELEDCFKNYNVTVEITKNKNLLEETDYNPSRMQYIADHILNRTSLYSQQKRYFRTLGVVDKDIYTIPLNFVFGIAMKPKVDDPSYPVAALISITRLKEEFYRRPINDSTFELRLLKEAIHELGHTFSLGHCNEVCIMQFSNTITDTDNKPLSFCKSCKEELNAFFQ